MHGSVDPRARVIRCLGLNNALFGAPNTPVRRPTPRHEMQPPPLRTLRFARNPTSHDTLVNANRTAIGSGIGLLGEANNALFKSKHGIGGREGSFRGVRSGVVVQSDCRLSLNTDRRGKGSFRVPRDVVVVMGAAV